MQLIPNGPDIPSSLLQAHEEGRVVFFCGAGISCAAGLPLFKGLVDKIYEKLNTSYLYQDYELEDTAYRENGFDRVLQLLERRYPGGKDAVRKVLPEILATPNSSQESLACHQALLTLATNQSNSVKLITTNYDHLFAQAAEKLGMPHRHYCAPLLPLPKQNTWDGIVYVHGLLPFSAANSSAAETHGMQSLNNLVMTSSDFGAAYLTERWAARFVTELFKKYVVCFIGYSLDDPILRYMVDALAADSEQGELEYQAYAFAGCSDADWQDITNSWSAKGVKPILYNSMNSHELLRGTLTQWASNYQLGMDSHRQVVGSYASSIPSSSTQEDDYVNRLLWALTEPTGQGARAFAEHQPVPPLEWLDVFIEKRYEHVDLVRFQVSDYPKTLSNKQPVKFSLLHRPTSSEQGPWQSPLTSNAEVQLDAVVFQLCRWMVRHLDQPKLLLIVAMHGGKVHGAFKRLIQEQLDESLSAEHRCADSLVIPEPMRRLWHLLLAGYMETNTLVDIYGYQWRQNVKNYGLNITTKKQFAQLIQPKLIISRKISLGVEDAKTKAKITGWVRADFSLAENHLRNDFYDNDQICSVLKEHLPALLPIVQQALLELLELMQEVGFLDSTYDKSYFHLPSISSHWQNRHHYNWTTLIELLRDGLLELIQQAPDKAQSLAISWFSIPFLSFKRLALFAASQNGLVPSNIWLVWLTQDNCLWHMTMQREVSRLLAAQAKQLSKQELIELEAIILAGRAESMYSEDITPEQRQYLHDSSRWLRLIKLKEGGATLSPTAQNTLSEITQRFDHLKTKDYQKEEFSNWLVGSSDPGSESFYTLMDAPKDLTDLIQWLKENSTEQVRYLSSNWEDLCKKHPCRTQIALVCLAKDASWLIERWRSALYIWAKSKYQAKWSWKYLSEFLINNTPDIEFNKLKYPLANWLKNCTGHLATDSENFYLLLDKLIDVNLSAADAGQIDADSETITINTAVNHALGLTAQALMIDIFKIVPKDGDGLTAPHKKRLEKLLSAQDAPAGQAHIIIAEYAIALFRLDQVWAEQYLIPRFDWGNKDAAIFWQGFLLAPRAQWAFLEAIKKPFIEAVEHYDAFGELAQQYVGFTTHLALSQQSIFTEDELFRIINKLPLAGLETVVNLVALQQSNASNPAQYWQDKTQPFYERFWPKDSSKINPGIAKQWLDVVLNTGDQTPGAFEKLKGLIAACNKNNHYHLHLIKQSTICEKHPEVAGELLGMLFDDKASNNLKKFLKNSGIN